MNKKIPFAFRISYFCEFCKKQTKHVFFDFKIINPTLKIDTDTFPAFCTRCNSLLKIPDSFIKHSYDLQAIGKIEATLLLGQYTKQIEELANNNSRIHSSFSPQTSFILGKRIMIFEIFLGIISFFVLLTKIGILLALIYSWILVIVIGIILAVIIVIVRILLKK